MTDDKQQPQDDNLAAEQAAAAAETAATEPVDDTPQAGTELAELKDKYLRLAAEFDNYKRRTAKERQDLFKTANQDLMTVLLPVIDDFERANAYTKDSTDIDAVRESIGIIYNKLLKTLQQKGLTPMESKGGSFDPDLHEAIAQIPAPGEELKGKVVDEVEKGYYLGDKVLRHAKVVLGQ